MNPTTADTAPVPAEPDRPRWPELQLGEQVTLTIDAAVADPIRRRDGRMAFRIGPTDDIKAIYLDLPSDHPGVQISRAAPADGVPQVGELWADQTGHTYFAVTPLLEADGGVWLAGAGRAWSWREVHTGPDGPIRRLMTVDEIASYR